MTLVVNTNSSSTIVQRNLTAANSGVNKSIERLSTGYKINKAADDAAGLAIATGFKSQSSGTLIAKDNTQHGINLLQTAEGDMNTIQEHLQRVRDLTVQAANGTYSSSEKATIAKEVNSRMAEITRLAQVSSFSEITLLDGDADTKNLKIQVGANTNTSATQIDNQIDISSCLIKCTATALNVNFTETNITTQFKTSDSANAFIKQVDNALDKLTDARSTIGAMQNRLEATLESLDVKYENMSSSLSTIQDTDVASEAATLTKNQILQSMSASLLSQANSNPSIALNLI